MAAKHLSDISTKLEDGKCTHHHRFKPETVQNEPSPTVLANRFASLHVCLFQSFWFMLNQGGNVAMQLYPLSLDVMKIGSPQIPWFTVLPPLFWISVLGILQSLLFKSIISHIYFIYVSQIPILFPICWWNAGTYPHWIPIFSCNSPIKHHWNGENLATFSHSDSFPLVPITGFPKMG